MFLKLFKCLAFFGYINNADDLCKRQYNSDATLAERVSYYLTHNPCKDACYYNCCLGHDRANYFRDIGQPVSCLNAPASGYSE